MVVGGDVKHRREREREGKESRSDEEAVIK